MTPPTDQCHAAFESYPAFIKCDFRRDSEQPEQYAAMVTQGFWIGFQAAWQACWQLRPDVSGLLDSFEDAINEAITRKQGPRQAARDCVALVKATMGDGDTRKSRGGDTGSTIADPSYTTSPTTAGVIEQLEAAKFCNPEVSVGNAMHNFALDKAIAIVQQAQLASRDGGGE